MSEPLVIIRDLELIPAENYAHLRDAGIKFIEQLGHELWTDYNVHDPGITTLEAFCFALTDLGYRTSYIMKDLLTRDVEGVPESKGKFHTAREIFSCNPITFNDLRKLLVDVRGVRNAWIVKHKDICYYLDKEQACLFLDNIIDPDNKVKLPSLNGLFEVLLEYEEYVRDLKVGIDNIACVKGNYIAPQDRGIEFEIYTDFVLREVSVYANSLEPITIELWDPEDQLVDTMIFTPAEIYRKEYVTLNFRLSFDSASDNIYKLTAKGDKPLLHTHPAPEFADGTGFELEGYLKMLGGTGGANFDPNTYYFFYDWEIELPALLGETQLTRRFHIGLENSFGSKSMPIPPGEEGIVFDVICPIKLESVCIYAVGKGKIEIVLFDEHGNQLTDYSAKKDIDYNTKSEQSVEVILDWEIPACQGYRLQVKVLEEEERKEVMLCMNEEGNFPHIEPGALILLGGAENGELTQQYYFFYDWRVSYEQKSIPELPDEELTSAHVKAEVRRRLRVHRNLCEESIRVKPIETEEIGLYADIEFEGENAEEILAEVYCRLEEYVKPAVCYYTWQQLMDKGLPADEVFSGPMLNHGFVDPDEFELTDRKTELRTSDIVQLLMDIPEVKLVKNIYLTSFIDGRLEKKEPWILCLENDNCLAANFNPERSGISLYRSGIPYQCNPERLAELLEEKRIRNRQVKLKGHQLDCPVPIGEDMDLADFYPMQNDLPITYLVGQNRVPDSATPQRRAQSNQLKAFLMFFEQMLANYLSQLNALPELFTWDLPAVRDQVETYFTQEVDEIVDLHLIYQDLDLLPYHLKKIIEKPKEARDRKNKFLDHLLARFAEDFSAYATLMYSLFNDRKEASLRLIEDKSLFFKHYPEISRNRAVGLDFSYVKGLPGLSGYQQRIYRKLGMYHREPVGLDVHEQIKAIRITGKGWKFQICDVYGNPIFESVYMPSKDALDNLIDLTFFAGTYVGKDGEDLFLDSEKVDKCWKDLGGWVLVSPCEPDTRCEILGAVLGEELVILDAVKAFFGDNQRPFGFEQPAELQFSLMANTQVEIKEDAGKWYFQIKDIHGKVIFKSVHCDSKFFVEELLEQTFIIGKDWNNYTISEDACCWELYACEGEEKSLIGKTIGLLVRKSLRDLFYRLCHAEGMHLLEHILLRPRIGGDPFLKAQFHQVDVNNSEEKECYSEEGDSILVADPYSFRMSLVLPAWSHRFANLQFRRFAEDTMRLEAPAHIYATIYWLSFSQMQAFEEAYLNWCKAYSALPDTFNGTLPLPAMNMAGIDPDLKLAIDDYQTKLKKLIDTMQSLKIIYPQAQLYDQANQQGGATQLTLGNMSLGKM